MIAVGLLATGASISAIVLTTFLINLRHLLMSAVLVPSFREWKPWQRILFGLQMSDETFAITANKVSQEGKVNPEFAFRVNGYSHFFWVFGSVVGFIFGGAIELSRLGLDFTLIGMLIGLWVIQIKSPRFFALSLLAGLISSALVLLGLSQSVAMLIAAVIGPTIGLLWKQLEARAKANTERLPKSPITSNYSSGAV